METPNLTSGLRRLTTSSKYLLALAGTAAVIVLVYLGKVDENTGAAVAGALIVAALGATAHEDAAGKRNVAAERLIAAIKDAATEEDPEEPPAPES